MAVFRTLLIIFEAACCLALIGLILLQKSKDGGLGMAFGAGGGDSLFGARAGNVLTKATVMIGIFFLANTLLLGILFAGSANKSVLDTAVLEQPVIPAAPSALPQVPAEFPATLPAQ